MAAKKKQGRPSTTVRKSLPVRTKPDADYLRDGETPPHLGEDVPHLLVGLIARAHLIARVEGDEFHHALQEVTEGLWAAYQRRDAAALVAKEGPRQWSRRYLKSVSVPSSSVEQPDLIRRLVQIAESASSPYAAGVQLAVQLHNCHQFIRRCPPSKIDGYDTVWMQPVIEAVSRARRSDRDAEAQVRAALRAWGMAERDARNAVNSAMSTDR